MKILIMVLVFSGGWKTTLISTFNLSEAVYNGKWQKDDVGNIAWNIQLNGEASRILSNSLSLKNKLTLLYGQTILQNAETGKWGRPVKSQDKIEDENVLTLKKNWAVDPYVSFYFSSQFYDEPDSTFLNPMTFQESFGLARDVWKEKNKLLNSRFGIAFRQKVDRKHNESLEKEGGFEWVTHGKFKLSKTSVYEMNFRVFKALVSNFPDSVTTWKTPDISFENILTVGVTKYININAYLLLFYDRDQVDAVQIKQTMSIGVTFNLL